MSQPNRYLVLRFSSIGDVVQALSIPSVIRKHDPNAQVDFLTRQDMAEMVNHHPNIHSVISYDKSSGFRGLWNLAQRLRGNGYTHIYDVHNNLRSRFICYCLNGFFHWRRILKGHKFLRRSNYRLKRFLLFKFRVNLFEKPFAQQKSLLKPLEKWGFESHLPAPPQFFLAPDLELPQLPHSFIALSPSASYELKRWPLEYWIQLVQSQSERRFVVLGGPADISWLEPLRNQSSVIDLVGQLSLSQSAGVIQKSSLLISNDTGLMHMAEQMAVPCIALMGPAPFGFPSRLENTIVLEKSLSCRPCSKHGQGPCTNPNFHECMRAISVEEVSRNLEERA